MAKYALFEGSSQQPLQVYEGDDMYQDGVFVKIVTSSYNEGERLVAAIHLDKNQCVKKLGD